jgi:hydroxymethylbilane synthase
MGTRGSLLARTQSGHVAHAVTDMWGERGTVEEVIIRTEGDDTSTSLTGSAARPGVFVSALRDALLAGEVDFIVHSFKDLPSAPFEGITLAAVPLREDERDVLVSKDGLGLADLPAGAVVGTSSPRRAARVQFARPDLAVKPIRGNIDTRIQKVRSGEYDATILAAAGLNRVGYSAEACEFLGVDVLLPAPAQGALAIECRSDDNELLEVLYGLNDPESRLVTTAERAVLVGVAATCATAIGALGVLENGQLTVTAELSDPDANEHERFGVSVPLDAANYNSPAALREAYETGLFVAAQLMATELGMRIREGGATSAPSGATGAAANGGAN